MIDSEMATNPQATGNMRWYVIHAYSGMEKSVKKGLEERIARSEMTDKFGRILVPSQDTCSLKWK
jgi:transcriptional antiterminator NusG